VVLPIAAENALVPVELRKTKLALRRRQQVEMAAGTASSDDEAVMTVPV
jgi:hypothetical protein